MKIEQAIKIVNSLCDTMEDSEKNSQAVGMALEALREKQERENPEPLTLEKLREMREEPVWGLHKDYDAGTWLIATCGWIRDYSRSLVDAKAMIKDGWKFYDHKPGWEGTK